MTIAMSCKLIDLSTEIMIIDQEDKAGLEKQLKTLLDRVRKHIDHDYSLFVVGDALIRITEYKL